LSRQSSLGRLDNRRLEGWQLTAVRWLLPIGWGLAALGYLGPWIAHPTAALTLSGGDMAEFVKFLPGVLEDSPRLVRQLFYLPPFAVSMSIALLVGLDSLQYAWFLRSVAVLLAVPVSLQLLPPAWSPSSLMTAEFRTQTVALGICWLLLACFWLMRRLPEWLLGSVSAALSLLAIVLPAWQYLAAKPAIDNVYGLAPGPGWGIILCFTGLAVTVAASAVLALSRWSQTEGRGTRA
jgi:hypothetical protein